MGGPRLAPGLRLAAFDSVVAATVAADRADRQLGLPAPQSLRDRRPAARRRGGRRSRPERTSLGLPTKYADLTLDGQARLEIRTDRVREERCTPGAARSTPIPAAAAASRPRAWTTRSTSARAACSASGSTSTWTSTPSGITPANNNVQIYYEGLEDEIVRRVDVGTVVFQPPPSRFITAAVPANNFGVNATLRGGAGAAPDPRRHPEGKRGRRADLHRRPDHEPGAGPPGARPRLRERPLLLGGRPRQPAGLPGARHPQADHRTPCRPRYRPSQVRVYRYRAASSKSGVNPNLGGITALARPSDSPQQLRPGPLGAADPGHRLLPGPVRALDRAGHQARPERLPGGQLSHGGGTTSSAPFPRSIAARSGSRGPAGAGHARADRPAAAGAEPPDLPLRDAAGLPGGRRRPGPSARCRSASRSTAPSARSAAARRPTCSCSGLARAERRDGVRSRPTGCFPAQQDPGASPGHPRVVHRLPAPPAVRRPRRA